MRKGVMKKNIFLFLIIINIFLTINFVSAETLTGCCHEMTTGATCQSLEYDSNDCLGDILPSTCNLDPVCNLGCCIDDAEGTCDTVSAQSECDLQSGTWNTEDSCNVGYCEEVCCDLGSKTEWVTNRRCVILSAGRFDVINIKPGITSETECILAGETQTKGACVINGNTCQILSSLECSTIEDSDFEPNTLCSSSELNAGCDAQDYIGCVEGKDEIYWFDSCGNPGNIYDADLDETETLLTKSESCNANENNAGDKKCGNCNRFLGSICAESKSGEGVEAGDFTCKDLNCAGDIPGTNLIPRTNGESWCGYDGSTKLGMDTIGSRHWIHECIEGEVKSKPCADGRAEICDEEIKWGVDMDNWDISTIKFQFGTQAQCKPNNWEECLALSIPQADKSDERKKNIVACVDNPSCYLANVDDLKRFHKDEGWVKDPEYVCLPNYPPALLDANQYLDKEKNAEQCSIMEGMTDKDYSTWYCGDNEDCSSKVWLEHMNDICTSFGDCGIWPNYQGNFAIVETYFPPKAFPGVSWSYIIAIELHGWIGKELPVIEKILDTIFWSSTLENDAKTDEQFDSLEEAFKNKLVEDYVVYGYNDGIDYGGRENIIPGIRATEEALDDVVEGAIEVAVDSIIILGGCAIGIFIPGLCEVATSFAEENELPEPEYSYSCLPWTPPIVGYDCESCNDNPLRPCSPYRCQSIGAACEIAEGTESYAEPRCITSIDFKVAPNISSGEINKQKYKFEDEDENYVKIERKNGECIREFQMVKFSLETDRTAQCKYGNSPDQSFDEMPKAMSENDEFEKEHFSSFDIPNLDSLDTSDLSGDIKQMLGNLSIYVRCRDTHGNFNEEPYIVNFCIHSGPDTEAAEILEAKPVDGSYLIYGETEKNVTFYMNEPAECKYDIVLGKDYGGMANTMECGTEIIEDYKEGYGWPCKAQLTGLHLSDTIYIKCKDQPWFTIENDSLRNINQGDYKYTLHRSPGKLEIDSIKVQYEDQIVEDGGIFKTKIKSIAATLKVVTSGGMASGKSICRYGSTVPANKLSETDSNNHQVYWNSLPEGNKTFYLKCEDEAGNVARGNISFEVRVDDTAPSVIRVYHDKQQGKLKLITNENAKCAYSETNCSFALTDGVSMTSGLNKDHNTPWDVSKTYYVRCSDSWDNINNGCVMVVEPTSLI